MKKLDLRALRQRSAAAAGEFRSETRRLVLVYCAVVAVLTLGSNGLNLLLDSGIAGTGGLGGLQLRSVLQTVKSMLGYANMIFTPFWSAGFLFAMLAMVRGRAPRVRDLTGGLRCFGRVLGYQAFEFLMLVALVTVSVNLAAVIFTMSNWGAEFAEKLMPLLADPGLLLADGTLNMDMIPADVMMAGMIPLTILSLVIFLPVYLYVTYCFRMALYLVVEGNVGGVRAHFESARLLRGCKRQILKLDLQFWWYYALAGLAMVAGYLDVILGMVGVQLPINGTVLYFLTLAVYCILEFALSLWKKCEVDGTYVLAFEAIAHPETEEA